MNNDEAFKGEGKDEKKKSEKSEKLKDEEDKKPTDAK